MEAYAVPGVALAVYDGEKETLISYGVANKNTREPVTRETIFEIASITKVFTSTALALHVLQKDMSLNDPLTRYLPAVNKSFGAINQVTLLNLATHSSSLPRTPPSGALKKHQIVQFLQFWHPNVPIGTHYLYSNLAFGLLGYALENVEHRSFQEVMAADILDPLGMFHTFTEVPPKYMHLYSQGYGPKGFPAPRRGDNNLPGGGALRSTAEDMSKFLMANLNLKAPEKLRSAMQLTHQPFFKVNENLTLGLGWQRVSINGMLVIDKNGGLPGYSSYIGMIPKKKMGVVVLINKSKAESTRIGRELLKLMSS